MQNDPLGTVLASMVVTWCSREQTVDGDSYVGNVNSNDGQANFDRSNGNANDRNGFGLVTRW